MKIKIPVTVYETMTSAPSDTGNHKRNFVVLGGQLYKVYTI